MLQESSLQDLPELSHCHMACFPGSLSVKLGMAYVQKSLEWFLTQEHCFLFHLRDNGNIIVGYCGGIVPRYTGDGSSSGMLQYAMKEAITGVIRDPLILFNPEIIRLYPLILKNINRKLLPSKKHALVKQSLQDPQYKRCGLVVIGVHPDYRGKGYFEQLMQAFEAYAVMRNARHLTLSVKSNNLRAIKAYSKCGWLTLVKTDYELKMYKELVADE